MCEKDRTTVNNNYVSKHPPPWVLSYCFYSDIYEKDVSYQ
jgi:hypothetical protein